MPVMERLIRRTLQAQTRREDLRRSAPRRAAVVGQSSGSAAVAVAGQVYPAKNIGAPSGQQLPVRNSNRIANAVFTPDNMGGAIYISASGVVSSGGGGGGGSVVAGDGINVVGDVVSIKLKSASGLEVDPAGLAVKLSLAGAGLGFNDSTKVMSVNAGDGIDILSDSVTVDVTDLIDVNAGLKEDASNNIQVKLAADSGLAFASGGVALGTPADLTYATTNDVTGSSHTHQVVAVD